MKAVAIATEDIFESFGHGETNPEAIHAFLRHVYHEWREPRLRYVLLLGDGSYDFKDRLGTGVKNHVPPLLVRTQFLWTASDPGYAAVNGDDRYPDIAIGRIPASSVAEVTIAVDKILEHERSGSLDGTFVLVADDADEAGNFEAHANELSRTLLSAKHKKHIYLRELGATGVRREVASAFENGSSLVTYIGHGGIHLWADENAFNTNDVRALSPHARHPIVLTMNCLNGFFHFPYFDAFAESLIVAEDRGAVAAISPTGLSLDGPAHELHRAILRELISDEHGTLGDALLAAQKAYVQTGTMPELVSIYHLFGDPALTLR